MRNMNSASMYSDQFGPCACGAGDKTRGATSGEAAGRQFGRSPVTFSSNSQLTLSPKREADGCPCSSLSFAVSAGFSGSPSEPIICTVTKSESMQTAKLHRLIII